MIGQVHDFGL
ncbi:Protein of unknown function [Thermobacillus xylanilyticus]|uniref:Uncharacterized protein n=1 Tax=Thermobacillus xylanilyticus TaxID=76633 RepID=A0ABN7S255_THEXY|nr:Protein of unknown function [Thermobacillus xylanilyticus]